MPRFERIKGLPVITLGEGKEVGKVDDLLVDPDRKRVGWLRLHSGGIFGERQWVPVEAVHGMGEYAVTINAEADLKAPADAPQVQELSKTKRTVIGSKAVTEGGQHLGQVRDYEFRDDTFALSELHVHPEFDILGQFKTIPADKIMTIGEDVIVVANNAVAAKEKPAELAGPPPA